MTRSSVPVERMVSLPATGEPCQYLEWDSTFFGHRIARATHGRLSPDIAAEVERWCVSHRIDCVYLLARSDDFATVRTAASCGFYLVDVRVTLEVDAQNALPEIRPEGVVRPWTLSDVPSLREIARRSHHGTRFYADERFDAARCDELYAEWIVRSCRGDADAVFVAELDHGVAGYLSCHAPESKVGQIGLAAVTEAARGRGLGSQMLGHAMRWFAKHGVGVVSVVTQGGNKGALRFYQRHHGFTVQSLDLWYHRWLGPSTPGAAP